MFVTVQGIALITSSSTYLDIRTQLILLGSNIQQSFPPCVLEVVVK